MRIVALLAFVLSLAVIANAADLLHADSKTVVKGEYIVVFHQNASVAIRDMHVAELEAVRFVAGDKILNRFDIGNLIGYSAVLSDATLKSELVHQNIKYIEANQVVSIHDDEVIQTGATWGIDRIDQTTLPLNVEYRFYASAGAGVTAYVIDTGVLITHTQFAGRAVWGYNAVVGSTNSDLNGHGTHVAGTIGGDTYGVAKKVTIVAVKVLGDNGSGTNAGVIDGINWAAKDSATRKGGSVANMSLGGGLSTTLNAAVDQSAAVGLLQVVAAGNSNANACNYSPASAPSALSVGATTSADARASFSNFGTCVQIFAPGNLITSSWIGSNTAVNTISGTSMAAPHVAGAVAVYFGHLAAVGTPLPPPAQIAKSAKDFLIATAIDNVVTPVTTVPRRFLYSQYKDAPTM
jgi:subtilisin family serine protease